MRRTAGIPVEHGLSARFAVRRSEVGENISGQKMQGKRHVVLHCGEQHGAMGRALTRMDAKEFRQPERDGRNIGDQHQHNEKPAVEGQHRFNDLFYLLLTHRAGDEKY